MGSSSFSKWTLSMTIAFELKLFEPSSLAMEPLFYPEVGN